MRKPNQSTREREGRTHRDLERRIRVHDRFLHYLVAHEHATERHESDDAQDPQQIDLVTSFHKGFTRVAASFGKCDQKPRKQSEKSDPSEDVLPVHLLARRSNTTRYKFDDVREREERLCCHVGGFGREVGEYRIRAFKARPI